MCAFGEREFHVLSEFHGVYFQGIMMDNNLAKNGRAGFFVYCIIVCVSACVWVCVQLYLPFHVIRQFVRASFFNHIHLFYIQASRRNNMAHYAPIFQSYSKQ